MKQKSLKFASTQHKKHINMLKRNKISDAVHAELQRRLIQKDLTGSPVRILKNLPLNIYLYPPYIYLQLHLYSQTYSFLTVNFVRVSKICYRKMSLLSVYSVLYTGKNKQYITEKILFKTYRVQQRHKQLYYNSHQALGPHISKYFCFKLKYASVGAFTERTCTHKIIINILIHKIKQIHKPQVFEKLSQLVINTHCKK